MKTSESCVHIYCGDGKGKTSAAVGLAVRAAGRGKKVLMVRFLKNEDSGEVEALKYIPRICVKPCEKSFGFFWQMTREEKEQAREYFGKLFRQSWREALEKGVDMVVLDEIMAACRYGLVPEGEVVQCLRTRPGTLEVVLTGRDPSDELIKLADYVSDIRKEKHPFDRGLPAREGIEY